ncbi:MAG: DUF2382 domain-containing protein [Armatimonadetes bacterium]|jgi:uncharacterized protein (TIGR02271 family)|nr:DUF2382 domain-containing protein [Armatimonadota bacterium]
MEQRERYPLGEEDRFRVFSEGTYRREDLDLTRLEKLEHWTIAEGEPDIRGWGVYSNEGEQVGQVEDLIASPKTRQAYFLLARIGGVLGIGGKHVLVPLDMIHLNRDNQRVEIDGTRDHLENAVEWHADRDVDYTAAYRYWEERIGRGGMKERHEEERHVAGVAGGEAPSTQETRIPLREEEMVARHEVHTGEVEIEKHVESEERTIEVPVTHTEVEIERRPVTGKQREHVEGEITEGEVRVPVMEEEIHVEKRPVVKEEIVVRQHPETETVRRTETIRREVAEVHKEGDVDIETKGDIDVK